MLLAVAWSCRMERLSRTLIQLHLATRGYHVAADAPWRNLLTPTVRRDAYIRHLVKVYGFEAPLEAAFRYTPGLTSLIDLRARARSGLLAQDLIRLGLGPSRIAQLTQRFATFASTAEALGWMYVTERATLIHGTIRRHLLSRIPEVVHASAYLTAYDGETGDRWSELGAALEAAVVSPVSKRLLVRSASQAFAALRTWFMDEPELSSLASTI